MHAVLDSGPSDSRLGASNFSACVADASTKLSEALTMCYTLAVLYSTSDHTLYHVEL